MLNLSLDTLCHTHPNRTADKGRRRHHAKPPRRPCDPVRHYLVGLRWYVVDADGLHYLMPWTTAEAPKAGDVRSLGPNANRDHTGC